MNFPRIKRRNKRALLIKSPVASKTNEPILPIAEQVRRGKSMKKKKPTRKPKKKPGYIAPWDSLRKDIHDFASRWLSLLASEEIRIFHNKSTWMHPTVVTYRSCITTFWEWLKNYSPELDLAQIRRKDVNIFRDWMIGQKHSSRTIAVKISGMSSFWLWILDNEIFGKDYTYNPFSGMRLPGIPQRIPKAFTDEEDRQILESGMFKSKESHYIAILLMRFAGLRISETYDLEISDIKEAGDTFEINVQHGKGNKQRTTFLFPYNNRFNIPKDRYIQIFRKYLTSRAGETNLFNVNKYPFYAFFERQKKKDRLVPGFIPHRLRHTFATTLLRDGVSRDTLADLLGHESTATTKIYSQMTPELLKNKAFKEMHQ